MIFAKYVCKVAAVFTALAIMLAWPWAGWEKSTASGAYDGKLIRFHVIANSDSPADQALKLRVRDNVVRAMEPVLCGVEDIETAKRLVDQNIGMMTAVAAETISSSGSHYPVKVMRGNFDFPEKTYHIRDGKSGETSDLTLPAGKYEAVRVVIGSGEGANWWCVLFPPLCFVNPETTEDMPQEAPDAGRGVGADPAAPGFRYDWTEPGQVRGGPVVEYRFKVVEWYRIIKEAI
ncbi:MAG: stage II sporulation protein R [Bacillota bacterium]